MENHTPSKHRFSLVVENYKVLRHVVWDVEPDVCVLVGANGAGKTTLLSALEFLGDVYRRGIGPAFEFTGGRATFKNWDANPEDPVRFRLSIDNLTWEIEPALGSVGIQTPLAEQVCIDDVTVMKQVAGDDTAHIGNRTFQASERPLLSRGKDLAPEVFGKIQHTLQVIRGFRLYQNPHLYTLRQTGSSEAPSDVWLHPTGVNAFALLRNWKAGIKTHEERFEFVRRGLQNAFPELVSDLDFETAGQTTTVRFYSSRRREPTPAFSAPNGLLAAVLHLCAVASAPDGGIVAIDEIENTLHPYALHALLDSFRDRARSHGLAILLSTHSPVVLNRFNESPSRVFVMADKETLPVRLDEQKDPAWLSHFALGDLYEQGTFGAQAQLK